MDDQLFSSTKELQIFLNSNISSLQHAFFSKTKIAQTNAHVFENI